MFTKHEIKKFIVKLGNKYIFPDFHNKITLFLISLGAGIILTPTPFKIVFYNWLISSLNINLDVPFSLAEMKSNSADYWVGFGLIFLSLSHNIFSKWLLRQNKFESDRDTDATNLLSEIENLISSCGNSVSTILNWGAIRRFLHLPRFHNLAGDKGDKILLSSALGALYFDDIANYRGCVDQLKKLGEHGIQNETLLIAGALSTYYQANIGHPSSQKDRETVISTLKHVENSTLDAFLKGICQNYLGLTYKHWALNCEKEGLGATVKRKRLEICITHLNLAIANFNSLSDREKNLWLGYSKRNLGSALKELGRKKESLEAFLDSERNWESVTESIDVQEDITKVIYKNELSMVRMDILYDHKPSTREDWIAEIKNYLKQESNVFSTATVANTFNNLPQDLNILFVLGTRPEYIKASPIILEMLHGNTSVDWLDTRQHYDENLSTIIISDVGLPPPSFSLTKNHTKCNSPAFSMAEEIAQYLLKKNYNLICVIGDTNTSLAGALAAKKTCTRLAHVEAGLRSRNPLMIEEKNRIIIDYLSDIHFLTEPSAQENLAREGFSKSSYLVGNVVSDYIKNRKNAVSIKEVHHIVSSLVEKRYYVVTLHRKENISNIDKLSNLVISLANISKIEKVVLIVHPSLNTFLDKFNLKDTLNESDIEMQPPLVHSAFISLILHSKAVITDSGGVQEEAAMMKVSCFTLRDETERPITVDCGSNILCNIRSNNLSNEILGTNLLRYMDIPSLWDGNVSRRIIDSLKNHDFDNIRHRGLV